MSAQGRNLAIDQADLAALARLEADGFIERSGHSWKTTRRWKRAMTHAAMRLDEHGAPADDLRIPVALAIVDSYASAFDDDILVQLVEAMLPIELMALELLGMRQ